MQRPVRHRKRNRSFAEFARQRLEPHFGRARVRLVDEVLQLLHQTAFAANIKEVFRYNIEQKICVGHGGAT